MRPFSRLPLPLLLAVLTFSQASTASPPSPVVVIPDHISIPIGKSSTEVELHNTSDQDVDVRVRTFSWRQANPDNLEPTKALDTSVPQVRIPAGERQRIQIFFIYPPPMTEQAFQLVLDTVVLTEAESNPARRRDAPTSGASRRTGVPLFVEGRRPCVQGLQAEVVPHGQQVMVKVRNPSPCHTRLASLGAAPEGQRVRLSPESEPRYVLSGEATTALLPIAPGAPLDPWVVAAATSQGPFRAEVRLNEVHL